MNSLYLSVDQDLEAVWTTIFILRIKILARIQDRGGSLKSPSRFGTVCLFVVLRINESIIGQLQMPFRLDGSTDISLNFFRIHIMPKFGYLPNYDRYNLSIANFRLCRRSEDISIWKKIII